MGSTPTTTINELALQQVEMQARWEKQQTLWSCIDTVSGISEAISMVSSIIKPAPPQQV